MQTLPRPEDVPVQPAESVRFARLLVLLFVAAIGTNALVARFGAARPGRTT